MSPDKPTRDDAVSSHSTEEMLDTAARPEPRTSHPARQPVEGGEGAGASRPAHPPHVTENAEGAPLQKGRPQGAGEQPVIPPLAQGQDQFTAEESSPEINDESMYEGRPAEDKDRQPSSPKTP